jgi:predicted metal-dependent hydrolase
VKLRQDVFAQHNNDDKLRLFYPSPEGTSLADTNLRAMRDHLRAGIAIYNDGEFHAAHDAWEEYWLDLQQGSDDEQLLHGLIQFTAAIHHAQSANWAGVRGLAESGAAYLADLPADYREVNVGEIRAYLRAVASDPEHVERAAPPGLTHEDAALLPEDLRFEASAVVAEALAEEYGYDEGVLESAVEYARDDLDSERATSKFVTFVMDFARDAANRGIIFQRMRASVGKRDHEDEDVEGLFD